MGRFEIRKEYSQGKGDKKKLYKEQIMSLLRKLDDELKDQPTTINIVGGAALILYGLRDATYDIDAYFRNVDGLKICKVAEKIAEEEGYQEDWINAAVELILPEFKKFEFSVKDLGLKNIEIKLADPRFILAMKLVAARDKDRDDVLILTKLLGIERNAVVYRSLIDEYVSKETQRNMERKRKRKISDFIDDLTEESKLKGGEG